LVRFGKYVVASLGVSVLYWASLFVWTDVIGLWYMASAVLTAVLTAGCGFLVNNLWTWRERRTAKTEKRTFGLTYRFVKYAIVGGLSTLLGWTLLYTLTEFGGLWYMLSSVIGTFVVMVAAFSANNYWTWGKNDDREMLWLLRWWKTLALVALLCIGLGAILLVPHVDLAISNGQTQEEIWAK